MAPTSDPSPPPRPIVLSGPSGTGKSTLIKRLFDTHPNTFRFSVSHTTRFPRSGEQDGKDYNFVTREAFQQLKDQGGFLETAQFGGNFYGTSLKAVFQDVAHGEDGEPMICLLDIDMEGVKQVKQQGLNARICFIQPPSVEELEKRLRGRGTESEESIQKRLKQAAAEMEYCRTEGKDDKVVVNDDLDQAFTDLNDWVVDGGRYGK